MLCDVVAREGRSGRERRGRERGFQVEEEEEVERKRWERVDVVREWSSSVLVRSNTPHKHTNVFIASRSDKLKGEEQLHLSIAVPLLPNSLETQKHLHHTLQALRDWYVVFPLRSTLCPLTSPPSEAAHVLSNSPARPSSSNHQRPPCRA
jgi:hypothetical protein